MNFKQLTSVVAAGVVAASMVMPSATIAAGFTPEYVDAHEWATTNGIIKKTSIEQAEMTTSTTKAMMAKMLVNFAEKYGFVDANSKIAQAADCKDFADIDYLKNQDLHEYVIKACEYGIMWRDSASNGVAKNFAPQQKVSRAIFATALDRVLSKDLNNGKGNDWYTAHLNALNKLWIMKDTNNAGRDVIKGDVLLMLHRSVTNLAEKMKETSECTKLEQVVCMLGGECSEACSKIVDVKSSDKEDENTTTDDKVKSGKLVVTNEKNEGSVVISKGYTSDLDTITFSTDEEVTIDSITLERMGLSSASSIANIWLETEDGQEATSKKTINSKDTVSLSLKKEYRTIKGDTSFVVVVTTADEWTDNLGTNIGFKVTDIQSSAKTVKNNAEKVNLYTFADYTAEGIIVAAQGSDKTYNYTENEMYEVARMKVTSKDVAIKVGGFTLTNNGKVDLDDIDEVEVLMDGVAIKNVKSSIKKDDLVISFPEQEIAIKSNSVFTVRVSLKDFEDFGENIQFSAKTSDIIASETKNNVRVKIINNDTKDESDIQFKTYSFKGNKIEFTNTKLSSTIDIAQGGEGVIAKGSINVDKQAIKTSKTVVTVAFDDNTVDLTGVTNTIDSIELRVNGVSETEATKFKATATNGVFTSELNSITIDDDSEIELVVNLENDALTGKTFSVQLSGESVINKSSLGLQYDVNKETVNALGSITINKVKVQSAKSSLTNNITKKVEFNKGETDERTVFEGTYTAKKQNVKLNEVRITRTHTGTIDKSSIEFTVYVNGKKVASIDDTNFKNTTGTLAETFSDVLVSAEATADIKVIAKAYVASGEETLSGMTYKVAFYGEDSNNNEVKTSDVSMATIDFVDVSSVTTSSNAATKQKDVVLANEKQEVAHFIVKPANKAEKAIISKIEITGINGSNDFVEDDFEIRIAGTDYADDLEYDTSKAKASANDLNIEIKGETEVKVIYKQELRSDVTVTVKINDSTYESTRAVKPAIVRITSQGSISDKTYTQYTFDVDFADSVNNQNITGLVLKYEGGLTGGFDTISAGDTKSVKNDTTSHNLTEIEYYVDGTKVTITKTEAPDFFEIKGAPIVLFADK